MSAIRFALATTVEEREQIHRLNFATFVEELRQFEPTGEEGGRRIDRFDAENDYVVASRGDEVLGMVAVRGARPFSLEQKWPGAAEHLTADRSWCEIRLLAVRRELRGGLVLRGLLEELLRVGGGRGYDAAVISAYVPRIDLYQRLGAEAFGPRLGTPQVPFQPMRVTRESFERALGALGKRRRFVQVGAAPRWNLLPGPVEVDPATWAAFIAPPVSHRAPAVAADLRRAKSALRNLTGARDVTILPGSGTLANDAIAAQLAAIGGRGLILVNGEFGERLVDHARRHGLVHDALVVDWGGAFSSAVLWEKILGKEETAEAEAGASGPSGYAWIWAVHCETSTGVLNDLSALRALAARCGALLCLDVISSLAAVPLDLSGVAFASAASGKALRALPGLAIVFHDLPAGEEGAARVGAVRGAARATDLALWRDDTVGSTLSSNLLGALAEAASLATERTAFERIRFSSERLCRELGELGFAFVADAARVSPAVLTVRPPAGVAAGELGEQLRRRGAWVAFESCYLRDRGWLQFFLMSGYGPDRLDGLKQVLVEALAEAAQVRS